MYLPKAAMPQSKGDPHETSTAEIMKIFLDDLCGSCFMNL